MIKNKLIFRARNNYTGDWLVGRKGLVILILMLAASLIADSFLGELYFGGSGLIALTGGLVTIFATSFLANSNG